MDCPKCRGTNLRCVDSRSKTETTRRRHVCLDCNYRFSTVEIPVDEWKSINEKVSFLQKLLDLAKEGWATNET